MYEKAGGFQPDAGLITIHQDYRGQGLGRILFEQHLDWLYVSGLTIIPIKPENPIVERMARMYARARSYKIIPGEGRIIIAKR